MSFQIQATTKNVNSITTLFSKKTTNKFKQIRQQVTVRAESEVSRREALSLVAGIGTLISASPAFAAYGQPANVFGKPTDTSGFIPYVGQGFALLIPSKWNPSKEKDFSDVVFKYEDNFDTMSNAIVKVSKTSKSSIKDYGSENEFLNSIADILGQQTYAGETRSEGGFQPNKVADASLLSSSTVKDKNGLEYYNYELLTRTADGDEGGKHQLISATVSKGNLYVLKVQCGDKRWFKGAKKDAEGLFSSFIVA